MSQLRARSAAVALAAAFSLFAAACISDAPMAPLDDFEIDCATDDQPPAGSGRAVVRIRNFAFSPAELSVDAGTEVTWVNCEGSGGAAHTSTSDTDAWDSGLLDPAMGQYSRTFDETGAFPYHCTPHPFMKGTIRVE